MSLLSLRPGFLNPYLIMRFCLTVTQFIAKIVSLVRGGGGVLIDTASHISSSFLYSQSDPDVLLSSPFFPSPIIIMCCV